MPESCSYAWHTILASGLGSGALEVVGSTETLGNAMPEMHGILMLTHGRLKEKKDSYLALFISLTNVCRGIPPIYLPLCVLSFSASYPSFFTQA